MRLGTWVKSSTMGNSRRRGPIPLFLVVLIIIVNGISMNTIYVEDEGKRHQIIQNQFSGILCVKGLKSLVLTSYMQYLLGKVEVKALGTHRGSTLPWKRRQEKSKVELEWQTYWVHLLFVTLLESPIKRTDKVEDAQRDFLPAAVEGSLAQFRSLLPEHDHRHNLEKVPCVLCHPSRDISKRNAKESTNEVFS